MSSFATKLIVLALIVGGLVVFVKITSSAKKAIDEAQNPKTFSDQMAEDDAKHRSLPDDVVTDEQEKAQKKEAALKESAKNQVAGADAGGKRAVEEKKKAVEVKIVRKFKELDEIEKIEAERLFEMALTDRKIGRLPVTGYKLTVDNCRSIIRKFPGTEFDYKARRLLDDIPKRFIERYKLTDEEMDFESVGIVSEK
ncbi:MAG: hypothetical protein KAS96_10580 [Planctomycetes bacterium]|nr:hypothetical protein [Planctomycetota bacterium]